MNNLKHWLQRLVPKRSHAHALRTPGIDIGKTIEDALVAAGLQQPGTASRRLQPLPSPAVPDADREGRVATPAPAPEISPVAELVGRRKPRPVALAADGTGGLRKFSNEAGTRAYAVHVPPLQGEARKSLPMIVMLHGCTQSVADFAVGTRMNELADRHGILVVYPEQSGGANPSRCWNWFRRSDQARDKGEPSIIAGIAREACVEHGADPARIYVAGLSAGAAMAVILGDAYPEVFAGVAAHSGLRLGAAHDVASAFSAMKSGPVGAAQTPATRTTPTIVIQGDEDRTVTAGNGEAIIDEVIASATRDGAQISHRRVAVADAGRRSAWRTTYHDGQGNPVAEHWLIEGGGHAWFGGDQRGTYTDSTGPDASAAIIRFFGLDGGTLA